jgi:hypothetical protein
VLGTALGGLALAVGLANQVIRSHHARRHSLGTFASDVERLLPPSCPVAATGDVPPGDRLVLGYLLKRDIPRVRGPISRDRAMLVPASRVKAAVQEGFTLVAATQRSPAGLALVRGPQATGCTALVADTAP